MILAGNCLQMPQMQDRLHSVDASGRLMMFPPDPDYPWTAEVFNDSRLRVLKVGEVVYCFGVGGS